MRYNSSIRSGHGLRNNNNNKSFSIFTPFIILICIGIIGVLGFKLFTMFSDDEPKKGVKLELLSGTAEMKAWGTEQFVDIPSGSFLMEGDEIMSSDDSLMIMEFPDGTIIRSNGGADIVLEELSFEKEPYKIKIMLVHGDIWVNKMQKPLGKTDFTASLGYVNIRSNDLSVVSLENKIDEVVRVYAGASVFVDVMNEAKNKVVETITVGVGQEATFSKDLLQKFWNFESPSILIALSDLFRDSDWYKFNVNADKGSVDPENLTASFEESDLEVSTDESSDLEIKTDTVVVVAEENTVSSSSSLATPTITTVAGLSKTDENGAYVVTNYLATLVGTAPSASEVYVNDYRLQQFKSGDSSWTYFANAKYKLMKEGENVYNIYSKDFSGKKSAVLTIKVIYKPVEVVVPITTPQASATSPVVENPPPAPVSPSATKADDDDEMPDWLR